MVALVVKINGDRDGICDGIVMVIVMKIILVDIGCDNDNK